MAGSFIRFGGGSVVSEIFFCFFTDILRNNDRALLCLMLGTEFRPGTWKLCAACVDFQAGTWKYSYPTQLCCTYHTMWLKATIDGYYPPTTLCFTFVFCPFQIEEALQVGPMLQNCRVNIAVYPLKIFDVYDKALYILSLNVVSLRQLQIDVDEKPLRQSFLYNSALFSRTSLGSL